MEKTISFNNFLKKELKEVSEQALAKISEDLQERCEYEDITASCEYDKNTRKEVVSVIAYSDDQPVHNFLYDLNGEYEVDFEM